MTLIFVLFVIKKDFFWEGLLVMTQDTFQKIILLVISTKFRCLTHAKVPSRIESSIHWSIIFYVSLLWKIYV